MLQERIYDAWRDRKVLSLVSFDVKGACNGVNKEVLLHRLRERRIPENLVRWIDDFYSRRRASLTVNGHDSPIYDLVHAELPQGSPPSPILFLFFNANLVQNVINTHQGSMAFVDDYSAWVTGATAEENTRKIQERFISKGEAWEASSGATFEPKKTMFIHFTRNARKLSDRPLNVGGEQVMPKASVKILGVVFDRQLRFKEHAARAAKRGLRAVLALKRARNATKVCVKKTWSYCRGINPSQPSNTMCNWFEIKNGFRYQFVPTSELHYFEKPPTKLDGQLI